MADYSVPSNRLLPLQSMDDTNKYFPKAAIQSITMGIRVGELQYAIGYVQNFSFDMKREAKPIWQIEPYPNIMGDSEGHSGLHNSFTNMTFNQSTKYWPGEAVEVIPGKMGPLELKLNRYSVYTANLMAAVMRSSGAGVYDAVARPPHVLEDDATASISYVSLLQQVRPFDIYQIFVSPITGNLLWGRKFGGCWFTAIGEKAPEADKNEPIMEEGTVQATYLRPITAI